MQFPNSVPGATLRVVIDGNIGSGKTTQLKMFADEGFSVRCEPLQDWPLRDFYENKERWAFLLQMSILKSFVEQNDNVIFWERSPESSSDVFWKMLRNKGIGTDEEELVYKFFYKKNAWSPDIHIYIRTDPKICYERISKKRTQDGDSTITYEYLKDVHMYYEDYIATKPNVIIINGDDDPEKIHDDIRNATMLWLDKNGIKV